jgi:hypothetical protein
VPDHGFLPVFLSMRYKDHSGLLLDKDGWKRISISASSTISIKSGDSAPSRHGVPATAATLIGTLGPSKTISTHCPAAISATTSAAQQLGTSTDLIKPLLLPGVCDYTLFLPTPFEVCAPKYIVGGHV